MSTIERRLPKGIDSRLKFLNTAKDKNDNLPVGTVILTTPTTNRLNTIQPIYVDKQGKLTVAQVNSAKATAEKDAAAGVARMWVSHFYQALNNGIARAEFDAADRGYYSIDINSEAVPDMGTEANLALWGKRVETGEAARVLAGGTLLPFPTAADVKKKVDAFLAALTASSTASDALDAAQEDLEAQNEEADKVIKKIADEVETYHNEETPESMRANAREWGVNYVTLGNLTDLLFKATDHNNQPVQGVVFKMTSTGTTYTSATDGTAKAQTRVIGDEVVTATHSSYAEQSKTITIVEGVAQTVTFNMGIPVI